MKKRIAMWSGPRNISTAMMRSFENRSDTEVLDEPFYAYYLSRSGSPHPGYQEVIRSQDSGFTQVVEQLTKKPFAQPIQYQKLMTHHMFADDDLSWTKQLTNCFLIRHPQDVVLSYTKRRGSCTADDIGIHQQVKLYQKISTLSGQSIPIIDSDDVLKDPQTMLLKICSHLQIPFNEQMLSWPSGPRDSDGIWAQHWYNSVWASTGFAPPKATQVKLSQSQQNVVEQLMDDYLWLKQMAI